MSWRGLLLVGLLGCHVEMGRADLEIEERPLEEGGELTAGAWDDNVNYDWFVEYLAQHAELEGQPQLDAQEREAAQLAFAGERGPRIDLDVAIVFDTTGSMGDELSYLTAALGDIAADIEQAAPQASVRWALVAYRDHGDAYVTRRFDFTADLGQFQQRLGRQAAGDGGDYPEASEEALAEMMALDWRTDADTARLAFWFADAPHHPEDEPALTASLREAAAQDVRLYPVAASGVDDLAEITMRSAAQRTGGRYLFLTDDSGIGDEHAEPSIPCYFVTTLRHAMVRVAQLEQTGVYEAPGDGQILRTAGDPVDGTCTFDDGRMAKAF
jgi:hypothetical protein